MRTAVFWLGVVLAVDALIGLLGLNYWQKAVPRIPIGRIAIAEAVVAVFLLVGYFLTLGR